MHKFQELVLETFYVHWCIMVRTNVHGTHCFHYRHHKFQNNYENCESEKCLKTVSYNFTYLLQIFDVRIVNAFIHLF